MNIHTHLNRQEISNLCFQIEMPDQALEAVLNVIGAYDFSLVEPFFHLLLETKTSQDGFEKIAKLLENKDDDGFVWLAISLSGALCTYEKYQALQIPDEIFYDTMKCFTRFVNEHYASYGRYGFDRAFWTHRQLSQTLFRIGTLEFELFIQQNGDIMLHDEPVIKEGESFLSIHIPSDAKINTAVCHDSYKKAVAFFNQFYPSFEYKMFYCNTWLLSVNLKDVLPANSNILQFQSDFEICKIDEENTSYKVWVVKNDKLDLEDYPEDTSLQRNIKKHLQNGGKIGSAEGIIRKDKLM